jgi:replicative DNA helicase
MCCQARVDTHLLRKGNISRDAMDRLIQGANALQKAGILFDDAPRQSVPRIAAAVGRLQAGGGLGLVVVDGLQMIEPSRLFETRHEEAGLVVRELKLLAGESCVPILVLANVTRTSEDRRDRRPQLADLRETGTLEEVADVVMLLHRYEPGHGEATVEVIVAKQRGGPTAEITLALHQASGRMDNFAVGIPFES